MQYLRDPFLVILIGILMTPTILFAAPHEPSPAGGGWLELNPELGLTRTEAPWFPELTGTLTIEAWIYVDEPLSKQVVFSLVGQTDRFNCFLIGMPIMDEDEDSILHTEPGILSQGTTEDSGTMRGNLPIRQWVHYVATINRGAAVGSDGYIAEGVDGSELPAPNENRLVLGGIPVISGIPMMPGFKVRFASGIYIDELRISSSIRYKGNYGVPIQAFTADTDTIGLYHFDTASDQPYEDSSDSQIPLIRSEIDPEVLAENEKATAAPVLSKSEEELLQLIPEGIAYYDSLLKSGRADFLRTVTSVEFPGLYPELRRISSGTWKGTIEFSGRKVRGIVTEDTIHYTTDRDFPIKGTEQFAYDGETFETLRETSRGLSLERRSEIVYDTSNDPRAWGWTFGDAKTPFVMVIDSLVEVESIKEVRFNDSDVYHLKGNFFGVAIELWLNPKKSYRPERYVFSKPVVNDLKHISTTDIKFKQVTPDLWFPESVRHVETAIDQKTGTKTDVATTTIQFTNIKINEPIPDSRFSIEPPLGTTVFDGRTRESFKVPKENNK
ncbi:hypothetical protein C6499_02305 [Candidatus Poribacteria bacterium]|nr:MAG: hypothetical protein C6499_02305 [Candidatus Poribacteria bacterium]